MAPYATPANIQAEFRSIAFTASAVVNSAICSEMIAQEEALLDAEIAGVYTVPVTQSSGALSIMKLMTTLMVKARITDLLDVKTGSEGEDQGSEGRTLRERVAAMLERIRAKTLVLPGATEVGGSGSSVRDYNSEHCVEPKFERDTSQW